MVPVMISWNAREQSSRPSNVPSSLTYADRFFKLLLEEFLLTTPRGMKACAESPMFRHPELHDLFDGFEAGDLRLVTIVDT